jgi:cell division septum initiation protein DivIVA
LPPGTPAVTIGRVVHEQPSGEAVLGPSFQGESAAILASRLPRTRRGYDPSATDLLLATLVAENAELAQECLRLQEQIASLEVNAVPDTLVGKAMLAATSFAMRIREEARREAELTLRNASSRAAGDRAALEQLARDREDAERELVRLQQLTRETRSRLTTFLTSTLHELRPDGQPDEPAKDDSHSAPAGLDETLASALEAALQPENR